MGAQGQISPAELVSNCPAEVPGCWWSEQVFYYCTSQDGELRLISAKSYEVGGLFSQKTVDLPPDLPPTHSVICTEEEITSAAHEGAELGP